MVLQVLVPGRQILMLTKVVLTELAGPASTVRVSTVGGPRGEVMCVGGGRGWRRCPAPVAAAATACGQEPKLDQSKSNGFAHGVSSAADGGYQLMSLTEKFCGTRSGAQARPKNARMRPLDCTTRPGCPMARCRWSRTRGALAACSYCA